MPRPQSGVFLSKCRIRLEDRNRSLCRSLFPISSLLTAMGVTGLSLGNGWFGLTVVVRPDGECSTTFCYDPRCIEDRYFFDE